MVFPARRPIALALSCLLLSTLLYSGDAAAKPDPKSRIIILGFDGADPKMVRKYNADPNHPRLPHLAALAATGTFRDLGTTVPAQSPVSWASFATGLEPGNHGIFDFLTRSVDGFNQKTGSPQPVLSMKNVKRVSFSELPEARTLLLVCVAGLLLLALAFFLALRFLGGLTNGPAALFGSGIALLLGGGTAWFHETRFPEDRWFPRHVEVARTARHGDSIWKLLDEEHHTPVMLNIPVAFPAEPMPNGGRLTAGLGVPDLRKQWGVWSQFVTNGAKERTITGGEVIPTSMLIGQDGIQRGTAYILGLAPLDLDISNPALLAQRIRNVLDGGGDATLGRYLEAELSKHRTMIANKAKPKKLDEHIAAMAAYAAAKIVETHQEDTRVAIQIELDIDKKQIKLTVDGTELPWLKEHQPTPSPWATVTFRDSLLVRVSGKVRFQLIQAEPMKLFMSPIHLNPADLPSAAAISSPHEYARELYDAIGDYCTLGWPISTGALKDEKIDEAAFMTEVRQIVKTRRKIMEYELAKDDWEVLAAIYMATDRVQHLMWRLIDEKSPRYEKDKVIREGYGDAIFETYKQMDDIVGSVVKAHPNDIVMVISDHGFGPFRRGLNINTWLVEAGRRLTPDPDALALMRLAGKGGGKEMKLADLFDEKADYFVNTNWDKTQAYSIGLGKIYLNLEGREPKGTVSPTQQAAMENQIIDALKQLTDFGDLRKSALAALDAQAILPPDQKPGSREDKLAEQKRKDKFFVEKREIRQEMTERLNDMELNLMPEADYRQLGAALLKSFDRFKPTAQPKSFASSRAKLAEDIRTIFDDTADPKSRRVVKDVFKARDVYKGQKYRHESADLIVGFRSGWRVSWQTSLGGIPSQMLVDNTQKWSGDHCSTHPDLVPGIFFCNRKITLPTVRGHGRGEDGRIYIKDIAPTLLRHLGHELPKGDKAMDGVPFTIEGK